MAGLTSSRKMIVEHMLYIDSRPPNSRNSHGLLWLPELASLQMLIPFLLLTGSANSWNYILWRKDAA
jgi:hypothetical protein